MINVFIGKKGSGKTKKLIDYANKAVETSNGNVVVIEKGLKLTYDMPMVLRDWTHWKASCAASALATMM